MTDACGLGDLVTIVDDFLPEAGFQRLRAAADALHVYPPGVDEYPGLVWRLTDTPPHLSREIYRSTMEDSASPFEPLAARMIGFECLFGRTALTIAECSARLQVMRAGASLGCHADGDDTSSGGYAFYLTDDWDPHWGGLLLALDPSPDPPDRRFSLLRPDWDRAATGATGVNYAVLPKRNRLVLLRNPVRHMVTAVQPGAGDRLRVACTGYFRGCSPSPA